MRILDQTDVAKVLNVSRPTVSEATKKGYSCNGYDVRSWAVFEDGDLKHYEVPSKVFERENPSPSRRNGSPQQTVQAEVDSILSDVADRMGTTWPEAVNQNATPVAGTAGGTITGWKFLDVLDNHPETLSSYMLDLGFPLIAAAIGAYATTEETNNRMLKIALFAIGGWATIRVVQGAVQQWQQQQRALDGTNGQPQALPDGSEQRQLPTNGQAGRTPESGSGAASALGTGQS